MHITFPCVSDQVSPKQSLKWDSGDPDSLTADLRTEARGTGWGGEEAEQRQGLCQTWLLPDPMGRSGACTGSQSPTPDSRRGIETPVSHGLQGCPGWWRRAHYLSSKSALGKRSEVRNSSRCEDRALALWRDLGEEPAVSTPLCLEYILRSGTIRKKWWSRH